jgi:hypothetical protein
MANFKHLIIVTYGRSGSTLLQGILNSSDQVTIYGENGDFLRPFYNGYVKLKDIEKFKTNGASVLPSHSWHGIEYFSISSYLKSIQLLVGNFFPKDKELTGFKEIRFNLLKKQLPNYLDFLKQVWPEVCFVFLTRDLEEVCNSAWWKNQDPEELKEKLTEFEQNGQSYLEQHSSYCFGIDYSEVVENGEKLKSLFQFIGLPYNKLTVQEILDTPHSSGNQKDFELQEFSISVEELEKLEQLSQSTLSLYHLPEFEMLRNSNQKLLKELKFKRKILDQHQDQIEMIQQAPNWYIKLGKLITINKRRKKS